MNTYVTSVNAYYYIDEELEQNAIFKVCFFHTKSFVDCSPSHGIRLRPDYFFLDTAFPEAAVLYMIAFSNTELAC